MTLSTKPGVKELNIQKAVQIGASEACRNIVGRMAHLEPDPWGIVLPAKDKGRKVIKNRILPMFRNTEPLRELFTDSAHDLQNEQLQLANGFLFHLMWSGSASSMASDPMRGVICDEVNKYEQWVGDEADPVTLSAMRLRSYGSRALQINISTPTNRFGRITELYESSEVKLEFCVPCPHCGKFQPLAFERLRWNKVEGESHEVQAVRILAESDAVHYQCTHCDGSIYERDRRAMENLGRYSSEDGTVEDAETVNRFPDRTRVGIQISALHCLWVSWAEIVAEFLRCGKSLTKLFNFRTQTLGEPFEQQIEKAKPSLFSGKSARATLAEGVCPAWTMRLIAAIDPGSDHFWLTLRAWGPGMQSQRVWHGRVESFDELDQLLWHHPWPVDGGKQPRTVDFVGIDTGGTVGEGGETSRTMQVYRWILPRKSRVRGLKGASKPRGNLRLWNGKGILDTGTGSKRDGREVLLTYLDTNHWQDELHDLINRGCDTNLTTRETEMWHLNQRDDQAYNAHLAGVHKVAVRKGLQVTEEWMPISRHTPIHLRDCEVYQVALAYLCQVHTLPTVEQMAHIESVQQQAVIDQTIRRPRENRDPWEPGGMAEYL
jgi:phage terminase large subunit GpA-like protein